MGNLRALPLVAFALTLLLPGETGAQVVARSFDDLGRIVKSGDTVLLTDVSGREEPARIADVTAASLTVVTREKARDARGAQYDAWTARRVLAERDVQRIRRSSSATRKGALIGAVAALSVSLLVAATYSGGEGFCGVCLGAGALVGVPLGGGIGAGVGFGISRTRRPTIYLAPDRMDLR
jgi:hypothetical protein